MHRDTRIHSGGSTLLCALTLHQTSYPQIILQFWSMHAQCLTEVQPTNIESWFIVRQRLELLSLMLLCGFTNLMMMRLLSSLNAFKQVLLVTWEPWDKFPLQICVSKRNVLLRLEKQVTMSSIDGITCPLTVQLAMIFFNSSSSTELVSEVRLPDFVDPDIIFVEVYALIYASFITCLTSKDIQNTTRTAHLMELYLRKKLKGPKRTHRKGLQNVRCKCRKNDYNDGVFAKRGKDIKT